MVLHRGLGQREDAADRLVALPLRHQREHFDLPLGQPTIRGRHSQPVDGNFFLRRVRQRQRAAHQDFGWNVDAAGEHQFQCADHDGALRGFRNKSNRTNVECSYDIVAVTAGR